MSNSRLIPLIQYAIPDEKVHVNTPETKGEYGLKECSQLFNASLEHGIFYREEDAKIIEVMQRAFDEEPTNPAVVDFIKNPKNYFNVQYINKTCGYGLVANQDIPENTVVGIYSSEIVVVKTDKKNQSGSLEECVYDMNADDQEEIIIDDNRYTFKFRASKQGDFTRFAMHCPHKDDLDKLKIASDIPKESILTANMDFELTYIKGVPVRPFITTRAIKAGEWLAIDYNDGFWSKRGIKPSYFQQLPNQKIRMLNYNKDREQHEASNEVIDMLPPQRKRKREPDEEEHQNKKAKKIVDSFGERDPVQLFFTNRSPNNAKPLFRRKVGIQSALR